VFSPPESEGSRELLRVQPRARREAPYGGGVEECDVSVSGGGHGDTSKSPLRAGSLEVIVKARAHHVNSCQTRPARGGIRVVRCSPSNAEREVLGCGHIQRREERLERTVGRQVMRLDGRRAPTRSPLGNLHRPAHLATYGTRPRVINRDLTALASRNQEVCVKGQHLADTIRMEGALGLSVVRWVPAARQIRVDLEGVEGGGVVLHEGEDLTRDPVDRATRDAVREDLYG